MQFYNVTLILVNEKTTINFQASSFAGAEEAAKKIFKEYGFKIASISNAGLVFPITEH